MEALHTDLRHAVRQLRRSPGFTLIAVATLALAIGATTAMFSVVDGVLLKPLPVKDQDDLLVVWTSIPDRGFAHWPFSYAAYVGMRERLRTVSGAAAQPYAGTLPGFLHLDDGSAMPIQRAPVTGDWFDLLGARARAGRLLTAADDRAGAPPVVVLSSGLAERLFGGAHRSIGRRVRLQETAWTVVGVAAAEFDYPRATDAWVPAVWSRDSPFVAWDIVVRVAPGFTIEQTLTELASALRTLSEETGPLGPIASNQIIHAQTFADHVAGEVRPALLMLGAGVLLMLVVAGVNVANLVLARGLARRRELSVRAAIGARRWHLLRHLGAETFVLVSAGAALAVIIAFFALEALLALAPAELPRRIEIGINSRTLLFAAGTWLAVALVLGTLPAFLTARAEPAEALRAPDSGSARATPRYWLRHSLVVGQVAVTMVVLSTAGLLLGSFDRMQRLDLGFTAQDLFLAEVAIPPSRYPEPADAQRAMVKLAEHATTLPGVGGATAVTMAPFAGTQGVDATVFAEGQPFDESINPIVNYEGVDASYFRTLRLPILRGRGIDERDRSGSQRVVVVNQAFARLFWPGKDAIGRRLKWGAAASDAPWFVVVGVVADTRYRELTNVRPSIYVAYPHGIPVTPGYLTVRGANPPAVAAAIRKAVADREPGAVVVSIEPLPRLLSAPLARPRFQSLLASFFAAVALLLSAVGTYGVLSFLVRQRRREIGIRMALGAAPADVCGLVLRHGLVMGAMGVVLGVLGAVAAGRLVQPFLFGVAAAEPAILAATAAMLLVCVVSATLLPTRTAARTDPLRVLRSE
jgi:predicted permease